MPADLHYLCKLLSMVWALGVCPLQGTTCRS